MRNRKLTWIILIVTVLITSIITLSYFNKQNNNVIKLVIDDSAARYVLENIDRAQINKALIYKKYKGYQMQIDWVNNKDNSKLKSVEESKFLCDYFEECYKNYKKDSNQVCQVLKIIDELHVLEKIKRDKISQHLLSYLPSKSGFTTNLYLVVFTPINGTARNNNIMVRLDSKNSAEYTLNLMIHEAYHIGQGRNYYFYLRLYSTINKKKRFMMQMYHDMQFEGLATWVGFKALDFMPITYTEDYNLPGYDYFQLERDTCVRNSIKQINRLIAKTNCSAIDSLNKEAFDIGVWKRAYYVAGAYMSKIIEAKFGKEYLAGLINKNEKVFITEYNAIVTDDYKITVIE